MEPFDRSKGRWNLSLLVMQYLWFAEHKFVFCASNLCIHMHKLTCSYNFQNILIEILYIYIYFTYGNKLLQPKHDMKFYIYVIYIGSVFLLSLPLAGCPGPTEAQEGAQGQGCSSMMEKPVFHLLS